VNPTRFEPGRAMLLAGLRRHHAFAEAAEGIAAQWRDFQQLGPVPRQRGSVAYGVLCGGDPRARVMEYMTGVEVAEFDPAHLGRMRVPEQHYAVFEHTGPASRLHETWQAIWNEWLPRSGWRPVGGPEFELYGERFDRRTGQGVIEVWSPVRRASAG
jgi:AraC family transcriptional regulator